MEDRDKIKQLEDKIETLQKVILMLVDFAHTEKESALEKFWDEHGEAIQRGTKYG